MSILIVSTELYSYTEEPEFALNRDYFEEDFKSHGKSTVSMLYSSIPTKIKRL